MKKKFSESKKGVKLKLEMLQQADYNPREKQDHALALLKRSLTSVGQLNPLIVDESGVVLSGNRRLQAMQQLGWEYADCDIIVDLNKFQKKAILFAANTTQKGINAWKNREYISQLYWGEFLEQYEGKTSGDKGHAEFARYLGLTAQRVGQIVEAFSKDNREWVELLRKNNLHASLADNLMQCKKDNRKPITYELIENEHKFQDKDDMRRYVRQRNREMNVADEGKVRLVTMGLYLRLLRQLGKLEIIYDSMDDRQKDRIRDRTRDLYAFLGKVHGK
jgi:hypothetical protein